MSEDFSWVEADQYIYVTGPMRGIPDFNFPAFFAAEATLTVQGCLFVMNPARRDVEAHGAAEFASLTGSLDDAPRFDLRKALAFDLDWICRFGTHLYMLRGWESSKGAIAERALAEALGLQIKYQAGAEWHTAKEMLQAQLGYADGYGDGYGDGHQDASRERSDA